MRSAAMRKEATTVLCAMSGGVDSSVAAYLLKQQGFQVHAAFIRCWSHSEEGQALCDSSKDFADAQQVCQQLHIPLTHLDFSKQYWTQVFQPFLNQYKQGLTPNPDILCNKFIKFGCFLNEVSQRGFDYFATGHYARRLVGRDNVQLGQAEDVKKDQTFFLSGINQTALSRTLFPLENLTKLQVRQIAHDQSLFNVAVKKDSMGICFIGKRKFSDFIDQYIAHNPGPVICVDDSSNNQVIGQHLGLHRLTIGQRVMLPNHPHCPYYVYAKRNHDNSLHVTKDKNNRLMYCNEFTTDSPFWISGQSPFEQGNIPASLLFKFQHVHRPIKCDIYPDGEGHQDCLRVHLSMPLRAITPGQYAVFYRDNVCLGNAPILSTIPLAPSANLMILNTDKYLQRMT